MNVYRCLIIPENIYLKNVKRKQRTQMFIYRYDLKDTNMFIGRKEAKCCYFNAVEL